MSLSKRKSIKLKLGKGWKMPPELEPYRELIGNTGGNTIEDLVHRSRDGDCNVVINAPLALIVEAVESQLVLLAKLYNEGKLS